MAFEYFSGQQAEQFSFYRIPKVLFTDPVFAPVSTDAKLLYGILLDRMGLSAKNGWLDNEGHVYIIFTIDDVRESLNCSAKTAVKLLDELEKKCGLIERKRQGLGKPNLIFVKNFIADSPQVQFKNGKKYNSGEAENTTQELSEVQRSNTDLNNTDSYDTESYPFTSFRRDGKPEAKRYDAKDRENYREIISENICFDLLCQDRPFERDVLEEILGLMVEVVCSNASYIRVSKDEVPAEVVRSQFLKLDDEHIRYVLDCLKENTTRVKNMRQYLITALYNAPLTIGNYYTSLVNHDRAEGLI